MDFALAAVILGIKHSLDADHLLAVSNLLSGTKSAREALRLSLSWSLGHMAGALAVSALLLLFRDSYLPIILEHFELIAALMLVLFGVLGITQAVLVHSHPHSHGSSEHSHAHMHLGGGEGHAHGHIFGVGLVQGLASNDELLLLLTVVLGLSGIAEMAGGIVLFSAGVVAGMVAFGSLFSLPLLRGRSMAASRAVNLLAGTASVAYGAYMLATSS